MPSERLDLQEAADLLGVHYQTAYKWVRSGRLPAALVQGRYTLDPDAVEKFGHDRDRPKLPPVRRPRKGFATLADRLCVLLTTGNERDARRLVGGLIDDGVSLTTVMQDVVVPAVRAIGEQWHAGVLPISVEHRSSAIVERTIGAFHPMPRGRRRGTAVVAALEGDRHTLPTSMAAAALREDNWVVHHLGSDVPAEDLRQFCLDHDVDLVVLSVTSTDARPTVERSAKQLRADGMRTIVGHPGATLSDLQEMARAK